MSVNLANIYASLLRKYGQQYAVTYGLPPTYLCHVTNENSNDKIIFIYKEDQSKPIEYGTPIKFKTKSEPADNDDLIGSPLKDDCLVDAIDVELLNNDLKTSSLRCWKPEEEYHRGIRVETARSILCAEDFQLVTDTKGSVWILCNGQDAERTLFLQYEYLAGSFSRGLVTFLGVLLSDNITAQSMLQQHGKPAARLETSIENTYQFKNNIGIKCAWSTGAAVPSLIDLSICDVSLVQKVRLSECNFLTQGFVNQLQILSLLRDDIIAFKQASSETPTEPVYRCGRGIDMEDLRDSISKAITEIAAPTPLDEANGIDNDLETVLQGARLRPLNDLTDKMWEILKCCANYKNLKMAFNYLFQCAARCNVVNMPTNRNRLAEIITEVANGRLAIPCLTGSEPLELLLEIGLDKLQKDYEFVFDTSKVCNTSLLQYKNLETLADKENKGDGVNVRKSLRNAVRPDAAPAAARKTLLKKLSNDDADEEFFEGFKNSNFVERETATRLAKLLQIHFTLEHLLLMHTQLNLSRVSRTVCEHLLNKPVVFVNNIDESLSNEMEITLAIHDVREHLEGKEPHTRRICMKSKNKFQQLQSTFYYSMDKMCPPGIVDAFISEDKEMVVENIYYSWLYRKIQTFH